MQNFYLINLTEAEQNAIAKSAIMKLTLKRDLGNGNWAFYSSKPKSSLVPDVALAIGQPNAVVFKRFGFLTETEIAEAKASRKAEGLEKAKRARVMGRLENLIAEANSMGINVAEIVATVKAGV